MIFIFFQSLALSLILFFGIFKFYKGKSRRWGGIVLVLSFVGLVLMHQELEITRQLQGILLGGVSILLFGLWDDKKNFSWLSQLFFQVLLVGLLIYFGFQVDFFRGLNNTLFRLDGVIWQGVSVFSAIFIFFWVVGIINAINWLDGVDSSLGAVSLVGGMSILIVSFFPEVNQPAIGILASIFLGGVVSFLFFNFPPAKVEAGTSGIYFIGFILAGLAIIAGNKIITLMIVLTLPLLDSGWVILTRWRQKQSIFKKDQKHLHYRLRKLGWSDWRIFANYVVFLGMILIGYSLMDNRLMRIIMLAGEVVCLVLFFWWVEKMSKENNAG
jgi:UDP-GlcNAc:undecaprenyl-phosphate GlcNAc-1-phosphate transferase